MCVCTGDSKLGTKYKSLYVVYVKNLYSGAPPYPTVTITDPGLRLANATELGAEGPSLAPTIGYVYA